MTETHGILDHEHEVLLEELDEVSRRTGRVGQIYSEVLGLFRSHLAEENETIVPLLKYYRERLEEYGNKDVEKLKLASERFENQFDKMVQEHREISRKLNQILEELKRNPDEDEMHLAQELIHHVELEEEILYPAALAAGDLIEFEREHLGQKKKY